MSKLRSAKVMARLAPLGGWNTRDPLENMPETDAPILINWIPTPGGLKQRPGYASHVTSALGAVGTLMEYSPPSGSNVLFAAIGTDVYNVTAAGALGASVYGGGALTSAYWSHTMQTTAGTSVLFMVNGSDDAAYWNGAAWTNPVITNVSDNTLRTVTNHKNRLWFTCNNDLRAWYLPNNSIAGAATSFDLGPLAKLGGKLVNIGTWTRDGGLGPDDYIVFLTDKGEAIIYAGTDPSSVTTWSLVGTYKLPPPVGRRCLLRVGPDLVVLTVRGLIPLSQAVTLADSGQSNASLTTKIAPTFELATRDQGSYSHWQVIEYPKEKLFICNIPTSSTASVQYVLQTETEGWCKFENVSAISWSTLGTELYFGTSAGDVYKFGGVGVESDNTDPITSKLLMSFSGSKSPGSCRITMLRPAIKAPIEYRPRVLVKTNYNTTFDEPPTEYTDSGTTWDAGDWDVASWGGSADINIRWQAAMGFGYVFAPAMHIATDVQVTLNAIDVMYERGGPL